MTTDTSVRFQATVLGVVMHTFIPELGRQRQEDFYEFEASLVYNIVSSKPARATQ